MILAVQMTVIRTQDCNAGNADGKLALRFLIGLAILLLLGSCAGTHRPLSGGEPSLSFVFSFPEWFTGDFASQFVEGNDFKASLEIQANDNPTPASFRPVHGELWVHDGSLIFIPGTGQKLRRPIVMVPGGMSFLWNNQSKAAFVINEPMQAYAPAPLNASRIGAVREKRVLGSETVDGQKCQKWQIVSSAENGTTNVITVWRAIVPYDVPVKIEYASPAVRLKLSKIRFQPFSPDMFVVPDGFKRYQSLEAMTAELLSRRRSMMPRRIEGIPGGRPPGPPPGGGPP